MADKIDGKGPRGGLRTRSKRGNRGFSQATKAGPSAEVTNGSANAQGPANVGSLNPRVEITRPMAETRNAQAVAEAPPHVPPRPASAAPRDRSAAPPDGSTSIAVRTGKRELPLLEARALLAQLHERVASITAISNPREQGVLGSIWGDLARCDEKIAQAQAHQRSLKGEGEDARRTLDDVRTAVAALEADVARATAELEAEKHAAAGLAALARADMASAVTQATQDAELRCAALERRARIREATLKQAAVDAKFNGLLKFELQASRAQYLELRLHTLAHVIRQAGAAKLPGLVTTLGPLFEDSSAIALSPKDTPNAVAWLAGHAEHCMDGKASPNFEIAVSRELGDEAFVSAAYMWLLGRAVDDNGLNHYSRRLRTGMLHLDVLLDLAQSQEALTRLRDGTDVVAHENADFVRSAYRVLLGRNADQLGYDHYLARLDGQGTRAGVILDLARSEDAKTSGTPVSSAIRFIWSMDQWPNRVFRRLERYRFGRKAAQRRLWTETRFATLELQITKSWIESRQSLETLANLAEQRVAASHEVVAASLPAFSPSVFEQRSGPIASSEAPDGAKSSSAYGETNRAKVLKVSATDCLIDTSHLRNPAQIVALIRDELMYLGDE